MEFLRPTAMKQYLRCAPLQPLFRVHSRCGHKEREELVIRWMAGAIAAFHKPKAL